MTDDQKTPETPPKEPTEPAEEREVDVDDKHEEGSDDPAKGGEQEHTTSSHRADEEEMDARRRRRRRDLNEPEEEFEGREGFWDRAIGKRLEGLVPDVVKRTLVGSLGSMFMSEDGLKQSLTDLRLPKEVVTFIVQQADNTKREFMKLVAREMREFLESTNFYDELRKILTGLSFEIRTEVRLIPNDNAFVKPDVTNTIRVKRDGIDVPNPDDEDE